jgi:hypothetical protein
MAIMKSALDEIKGTNKIKLMEGERVLHLGQELKG